MTSTSAAQGLTTVATTTVAATVATAGSADATWRSAKKQRSTN
jgi:hypothetical protein